LCIVGGEHERPIRSLACFVLPKAKGKAVVLVGRTDGMLEVWEVCEENLTKHHASKVHKNGINCVCLAPFGRLESAPTNAISAAGGCLVVASGGDDQAVAAALLNLDSLRWASAIHVLDNAAASAVRGLWTDGLQVWAADLNQRLRVWEVEFSGANEKCAGAGERISLWLERGQRRARLGGQAGFLLKEDFMVKIAEPHCLAVDGESGTVAVVGGGGLQLFPANFSKRASF
jgi:hypothetical protein